MRTIISQTKSLLRELVKVPMDIRLQMNAKMKAHLAKWLYLPNTIHRLGLPEPTCIVQTDASKTGYGFTINLRRFQGKFHPSMWRYSINVLELLAIWFAVLMIEEKNQIIRVLTDNTTAITAIKKSTSTVYPITGLTELIWRRAISLNWTIIPVHIKGRFNVVADQLSRNTVISTEWSLPKSVFKRIILKLEPKLEVDMFATNLNNQLETYVSPCPDQQAAAVDALITNWNKWDHLYLFPPQQLISKALHKLTQSDIKTAIVISREEPTRHWYSLLKLQLTQLQVIIVRLQQKVGETLEREKRTFKLRMWRYSK